ncbi:MAG: ABC transporter permease subunit [Planctomycetaceae bacterium]|nr:ABC transporter permease subunit [Planctomycetaceae bacterium]
MVSTLPHSAAPAASRPASPEVEARIYSKDYWDLVLEQLGRRKLFRLGLGVLAVLYGLAIFAPLIGNDRPYKLVAIDYGGYAQAVRALGGLGSRAALGVVASGEEGGPSATPDSERVAQNRRQVDAVAVRLDLMRQYLPDGEDAALTEYQDDLESLQARAERGEAVDVAQANALAERAQLLSEEFAAARDGSPGKTLVPHTSYPLAESLGWGSIFFMVLWVLLVLFPLWNGLWNRRLLAGDRERIRRTRRAKFAVLLGVPAAAALAWAMFVGGGSPPFDVAPYKRGLTEGTLVAVEPPLVAPVPLGYAELHKEEGYRPPTWLPSSRLNSDGRYITGPRVLRPDAVTGFLPPPTPVEVRFAEALPNAPHRHLMGTDELGRDFFVRLLWGGRVSLAVGILSASLLTVVGVLIGSMAGYFGGWVDTAIMRVIEILQSIPAFFLILAALAFFDPKVLDVPPIFIIVLAIGFVSWTGTARLVRGEFLRLRNQEFVLAAQALGFSNLRTIFRHVLPNAMSPVLVSAAFAVASGILMESAVSFLGFGVRHPEASWGSLVSESRSPDHWWIQVFPGVFIFITVTCYNLVGDAVRDALDPKMKV